MDTACHVPCAYQAGYRHGGEDARRNSNRVKMRTRPDRPRRGPRHARSTSRVFDLPLLTCEGGQVVSLQGLCTRFNLSDARTSSIPEFPERFHNPDLKLQVSGTCTVGRVSPPATKPATWAGRQTRQSDIRMYLAQLSCTPDLLTERSSGD
jgi:hypothetical protein